MAFAAKSGRKPCAREKKKVTTRCVLCEVCENAFKSSAHLRRHQRDRHDGKQWKCKICELEMKYSRSDLGKYTHLCDKKIFLSRKSHPSPAVMTIANPFK